MKLQLLKGHAAHRLKPLRMRSLSHSRRAVTPVWRLKIVPFGGGLSYNYRNQC